MNSTTCQSCWVRRAVWGLLFLVMLSVAGIYLSTLLPPKPVDLPIYGDVPGFHLTNQLGQVVSNQELKGRVWIADLIFTRCPGPCLQMTRAMKAIHEGLPPGDSVRLVSLTADPEFDTPAVLKTYADQFKANTGNWHFLTGSKRELYDLAMKGLKLSVQENDEPKSDEDQLLHSTRFVLIDQLGRVRGFSFDGTEARTPAAVLGAVRELLKKG